MSTLSLRALQAPNIWSMPSFTRIFSIFAAVMDVIAEAQDMARAAHKRYPFAEG